MLDTRRGRRRRAPPGRADLLADRPAARDARGRRRGRAQRRLGSAAHLPQGPRSTPRACPPRARWTTSSARRRGWTRTGRAGITLATAPGKPFTAETFEHVALISGCQLVDELGEITLTSPALPGGLRAYVDLAGHSPARARAGPRQHARHDFAGKAAMIFWSPFLLDAMAGLRDDALPTVPECAADRAYLRATAAWSACSPATAPAAAVRQHRDLGHHDGRGGRDRQAVRRVHAVRRLRALAGPVAAGQVPGQAGRRHDPERYERAWTRLRSGVDRKAPLRRFYSAAALQALGDGARNFQRWGFEQGQAPLIGALRSPHRSRARSAAAIRGQSTRTRPPARRRWRSRRCAPRWSRSSRFRPAGPAWS
jgi:hypothetical protein